MTNRNDQAERNDRVVSCDVIDHIATLSRSETGWSKELNLVSWNQNTPKYDIRDWAPDHQKMSKGITLTDEEMRRLSSAYYKKKEAGGSTLIVNYLGAEKTADADIPFMEDKVEDKEIAEEEDDL